MRHYNRHQANLETISTFFKKIIFHDIEKSKEMKEFLATFGTQILNQDEINNLNKFIRYIEIEAVIRNILTKN